MSGARQSTPACRVPPHGRDRSPSPPAGSCRMTPAGPPAPACRLHDECSRQHRRGLPGPCTASEDARPGLSKNPPHVSSALRVNCPRAARIGTAHALSPDRTSAACDRAADARRSDAPPALSTCPVVPSRGRSSRAEGSAVGAVSTSASRSTPSAGRALATTAAMPRHHHATQPWRHLHCLASHCTAAALKP